MAIDYTTPVGQVRLLIPDTDECNFIFEDTQINGYISMAANGNVRLAAATAIEAIATSEALVSKVIRTQDLQTDGAKVSDSLLKRAAQLRKTVAEEDVVNGSESYFSIVDFRPGYGRRAELTEW